MLETFSVFKLEARTIRVEVAGFQVGVFSTLRSGFLRVGHTLECICLSDFVLSTVVLVNSFDMFPGCCSVLLYLVVVCDLSLWLFFSSWGDLWVNRIWELPKMAEP